jgi:hypothetical protein
MKPAGPLEVNIMRRHRWAIFPALLVAVAACSSPRTDPAKSAAQPGHVGHGQPAAEGRPVLYDSLGSCSYRITTASPEAQRWFDQGLRLVYAFNHNEAQKAFRQATLLDPSVRHVLLGYRAD